LNQKEEIENLEDFRKGYKSGFADGYMAAMKEVFELQEKEMEKAKVEMINRGILARPFW